MLRHFEEFPEQQLLWPGVILASIAHAIFVCRAPDFSHENSWEGTNYSVQNSAGSRGTIAFSGQKFVGVFFAEESSRNPFHASSDGSLEPYFAGLPSELQSLAYEEALQYVLEQFQGKDVPLITAAFWGDGTSERIAAAESWSQVLKHGAFLVQNQLLTPGIAIKQWKLNYGMRPEEVKLAQSLFQRKIADPDDSLSLTDAERQLWKIISAGQDGVETSRESFAEMGIILP